MDGNNYKKDYKFERSKKILCSFNLQTGETAAFFSFAAGMIKLLGYQNYSKKNRKDYAHCQSEK